MLLVAERHRHRWRFWMPLMGMVLPLILLVVPYAMPIATVPQDARGSETPVRSSPAGVRRSGITSSARRPLALSAAGDIDVFEGVLFRSGARGARRGGGLARMAHPTPGRRRVCRAARRGVRSPRSDRMGLLFGAVREIAWPYRGPGSTGPNLLIVSAALSVLAALAVAPTRGPRHRRRWAGAAILLVIVEAVSIPIPLLAVPNPASPHAAVPGVAPTGPNRPLAAAGRGEHRHHLGLE